MGDDARPQAAAAPENDDVQETDKNGEEDLRPPYLFDELVFEKQEQRTCKGTLLRLFV